MHAERQICSVMQEYCNWRDVDKDGIYKCYHYFFWARKDFLYCSK